MSRDRESEIETLRRENERLRREVAQRREAVRARRIEGLPVAPQEIDDSAAEVGGGLDGDRLAGRLEDIIGAMCVELTAAIGSGIRSINCKLDDLSDAFPEETPVQDQELIHKLEQLSTEIHRLRLELAAVRVRIGDGSEGDTVLDDAVSVPSIVIDQEELLAHGAERRRRRARRPWFYIPLVWGLVLLVLVLAAMLFWW